MSVKEAVTVAVIEHGKVRLGTAADAGALCVTKDSPDGVSGDVYRYYMREAGAPRPYQVRDPITDKMVSARDERGLELFDLDEVAEWNAGRPGPGAWERLDRPVKWTELRDDLVLGARGGRLHRAASGRVLLEDDELPPRALQRLGELVNAGLVTRGWQVGDPDDAAAAGPYRLTDAGRQWLLTTAGDAAKFYAKKIRTAREHEVAQRYRAKAEARAAATESAASA